MGLGDDLNLVNNSIIQQLTANGCLPEHHIIHTGSHTAGFILDRVFLRLFFLKNIKDHYHTLHLFQKVNFNLEKANCLILYVPAKINGKFA